jgi:hypothetical protein
MCGGVVEFHAGSIAKGRNVVNDISIMLETMK